MDARKAEPRGSVAGLQKAGRESIRRPLTPSGKNNAATPVAHKPRTREVTSRYKSGITPTNVPPHSTTPAASKRCQSPNTSRMGLSPAPSLPKRSQSAERRRPTTSTSRTSAPSSPLRTPTQSSPSSRPSTPVHDVMGDMKLSSRRLGGGRMLDGLWPAMRSLSASFQSESVSSGVVKRDKPVSNMNVTPDHRLKSLAHAMTEKKRTPTRGKNVSDQLENSTPVENSHVRVAEQHRWPGIVNGKFPVKAMSRSMDLTDRVSRAGTLPASSRGISPIRRSHVSDVLGRGPKKTAAEVTTRISLEGSGRLEREFGHIASVSVDLSERTPSFTRASRTSSLPLPGSSHPSSPSKASLTSASSFRSMASPSRTRPSTPTSPSCTAGRIGISSSVLGYILHVRKGKKSANHIEDTHHLRLLYNRYLQWRFINARADAVMCLQKITAENILYTVWTATSKMRDSAIMKRIDMQQLRQEMKLGLVLKDQMTSLEDWVLLEREHVSSWLGAIEALKASTIGLPVVGGARVDVHTLKDAISSAVDVMQTMGSLICQLLSMVEGTNSVVSELTEVAAEESIMLAECRELLASAAAVQVQESSLRAHVLQLRQGMIRLEAPIGACD